MDTVAGPVALETPPAPGPRGRRQRRPALLAVIGPVGSEEERAALRRSLEREQAMEEEEDLGGSGGGPLATALLPSRALLIARLVGTVPASEQDEPHAQ
ncbi:UNVERIFIED_CONTAM: hypothetical protein K2H54_020268 [Gekko kuhli]